MFDKIGESLHGFTARRIRESAELGGRLVELVYEKTGTELCWVDNGAENKLFSVTARNGYADAEKRENRRDIRLNSMTMSIPG